MQLRVVMTAMNAISASTHSLSQFAKKAAGQSQADASTLEDLKQQLKDLQMTGKVSW